MGRVERADSATPVPVEQAQLIDPSAFKFSTAGAEVMQQVGGVFVELGKRGLEAKNSLAINEVVESRILAGLKMQEFMTKNPDPDTWSKGALDIINEQKKIFINQRFNSETRKKQEIEQKAFENSLKIKVEIISANQDIKNDIFISGKNLISMITEDDDTPESAADISEQIELYRDALERDVPGELAALLMEETLAQGEYGYGIKRIMENPEGFLSEMADKKFLSDLEPQERAQLKSAARSAIARNKREKAEQKRIAQEQISSQLLADFWDGKLTDPQKITDAVRSGLLTDTDGKYLRSALLNPEPPTLNFNNYAVVKQAITDIGTGAKTKSEAMSVLFENLSGIDPATGKALVAEIFAEHEKSDAEMKREGDRLMEDLIRDKDPLSGFFSDDTRQILGASEAILMLDAEIQKAAKLKKPLTRRDILIKAVEIGQTIKAKIKAEKESGIIPRLGFIEEVRGKVKLGLEDVAPIFEKATINRQQIYIELTKLGSVWDEMNRTEKLKILKDISGGIKAESILSQRKKKTKSPYPEYPDAFLEGGKWKVIRDGKKYKIEE